MLRISVLRVVVGIFLLICIFGAFWRPVLRVVYPNPYGHIVNEAAHRHNVDPLLVVAMMRTESGFDPAAVSVKGARGLMQLMPDTARWAAEQMGLTSFVVDDLDVPDTNIALAVWYIGHLMDTFDHRVLPVVAAYNAGPGNVQRWLREDVWPGTLETVSAIPFPETRVYVQRVTQNYRIYRLLHPSFHGGYQELAAVIPWRTSAARASDRR